MVEQPHLRLNFVVQGSEAGSDEYRAFFFLPQKPWGSDPRLAHKPDFSRGVL